MSEENNVIPDWENSENWKESEWEQALKYSDRLASRYFLMLERFDDLPNAEELIVSKLGEHNFCLLEDQDYLDDWDDFDGFDGFSDYANPSCFEIEERGIRGDSLYFESRPVYLRTHQITLGWCNIIASVLEERDRFWGIQILFRLGRILSYITLSLGDGTFDQLNGTIIFAKRAIQELNFVIGEVKSKATASQKYESMFRIVIKHFLENQDLLVDLLLDSKKRLKDE